MKSRGWGEASDEAIMVVGSGEEDDEIRKIESVKRLVSVNVGHMLLPVQLTQGRD